MDCFNCERDPGACAECGGEPGGKEFRRSGNFIPSVIIGAATNSTLIGGLLGGDIIGGAIGDLLGGDE
jgi:hypothetical protein